jgi:hypothetical protein
MAPPLFKVGDSAVQDTASGVAFLLPLLPHLDDDFTE